MQIFIYLMLELKRGLTIYVRESEGRARETRCVYGGLGEALVGRIVEAMVRSVDNDRARSATERWPGFRFVSVPKRENILCCTKLGSLSAQKLYSSNIRICGPLSINTGENRPEI